MNKNKKDGKSEESIWNLQKIVKKTNVRIIEISEGGRACSEPRSLPLYSSLDNRVRLDLKKKKKKKKEITHFANWIFVYSDPYHKENSESSKRKTSCPI